MNPRRLRLVVLDASIGIGLLVFLVHPSRSAELESDVPNLLATRCVRCHGPGETEAGLRLDRRESAISILESGNVAIVPGDPEASELIRRVSDFEQPMPPEGERLTALEIEKIRSWILEGAAWEPHWAYCRLQESDVPVIAGLVDEEWARNPIDAFILKQLLERGLQPSAAADRRTLLRRVYYDLIGLPPTPQAMNKFLADDSPAAFERVVDQLLASPHYGERWARHWMDVVHYADSHGFEHDIYRDAWPYRDYLIRSFNGDSPFRRFVQEQVAGDVLFPNDPQALVATGFLATGPWDLSALQAGNPESIDYLISQYLDRDDIVSTVMSTFVSTTVGCARCHDHKFDPVSQVDYYGLQAVFAGIDKATRLYDPDPAIAQRRQELEARKAALAEKIALGDPSLLESSLQEKAAQWVRSQTAWEMLEPRNYESAEGARLAKEADGSLFSTGERPNKDVYTVSVHSKLQRITAIRLELLADSRLPSGGPGRQDNGNMHLNGIVLSAAPLSDQANMQRIALRSARADFSQEGWEVDNAIDDKPESAWGIHPQVGRSHTAVFELEKPLCSAEGSLLVFELRQSHGAGHLIGRFRLAAIDSAEPELLVIDARLEPLLKTPSRNRTRDQRIQLASTYLNWKIDRALLALPEQQRVFCATNKFVADRGHQPADVPRPIHVLSRGRVQSPGALAEPRTFSCIPGMSPHFTIADPADEGQRRVALARWLSDDNNVLTWRSIVNRIWHFHFGRGLVATPSDFGRMGARPTHPELLDWMAVNFRRNGGSLKWLHRLALTSNVYRQSSSHNEQHALVDADNRYLWRMNRTMLDAESIRDSLLQCSNRLDTTMGGPPVKQFVEKEALGLRPEADYAAFDVDDPGYCRRSVYRYIFRTMPDPFMNALDCPDASQRAPKRSHSITPLQAAAMLNDPFLVRQCEHIAARLEADQPDMAGRVDAAFEVITCRPPEGTEFDAAQKYAAEHGLAAMCRILLNSNEFMFVD